MAAVLLAFFSCSDDDNMDSTDPVLNRNEFVFSKLGGTDTVRHNGIINIDYHCDNNMFYFDFPNS